MLDSAPHDWLFPHMVAVVHHGGVGTTAAGLRAGKSTVICPCFGDQPYWGQRVQQLGVGPSPLSQKTLTVETPTEAIQTVVSNQQMRTNADLLGHKIQMEDGIHRAVKIIQSL